MAIDLTVCGLNTARKLAQSANYDCIISIGDSEEDCLKLDDPRLLKLVFHDVPEDIPGAEHFSLDHVYEICNHVDQICKLRDKENPKILVHCYAGISRSTSVAWGILVWLGMTPQDALDQLTSIRPQAWPKPYFIKHFDFVMNLKGLFELRAKNYNWMLQAACSKSGSFEL